MIWRNISTFTLIDDMNSPDFVPRPWYRPVSTDELLWYAMLNADACVRYRNPETEFLYPMPPHMIQQCADEALILCRYFLTMAARAPSSPLSYVTMEQSLPTPDNSGQP
jgi:hypothetical protein